MNENVDLNEKERDSSIINIDLSNFFEEPYEFLPCYINIYFKITTSGNPLGLDTAKLNFEQFKNKTQYSPAPDKTAEQ